MTREAMTSPQQQHYDADRILSSIDSLISTLLSSTRHHQQPEQNRQVIETRQHWSHGFAPGGRRSDPALKERQASKMAISSVIRYLLDRAPAPLPSAPEDEELLMDELSQLSSAPESDMATRQHWSNSWQPGGKRSAPSSGTSSVDVASEGVAVPSKRQHWSYGFGPGGKRSVELVDDGGDEDSDNL